MRPISAVVLTLATAVATAQAAHAGPLTADSFRKAVERKVAPPFGTILTGKWKALCVCNPTDRVGAVESFGGNPQLGVTCTVPTFAADGSVSLTNACYDWTPIAK